MRRLMGMVVGLASSGFVLRNIPGKSYSPFLEKATGKRLSLGVGSHAGRADKKIVSAPILTLDDESLAR